MMHILLVLCALLYGSATADPLAPRYALEDAEFHFEEFINKYNKQYADEQEKAARFEIFKLNLEKINQLNNKSTLATYGITPHLDLSREEFLKMKTGLRQDDGDLQILCDTVLQDNDVHDANAPESFDWREKGVVTGIKDQGGCGSCYAFSTIANIESQYYLKHKKQLDLSEREIVDCDKNDKGCGGGYMANAMRALKDLGGVILESDYPYTDDEEEEKCKFDKSKVAVKVSSCISMNLQSQEKLKQLLYKNGPIAVAISSSGLHVYHGGIIEDDACDISPDHAVLLVGYGKDAKKNNEPYWLLKNSWGKDFGEDGYFRMQRSDNANGACGMMNNFMASAIVE